MKGLQRWQTWHTTARPRTTRVQKITWNADGTPNLGHPLAAGATQDLPAGAHTLKVRVTGEKNAASTSTVISLDRIEVY